MNEELELYKLCCTDDNEYEINIVDEIGWISNTEFCVWVSYVFIERFIEKLAEIFGKGIFDDGGFTSNMQENGCCIDLCEAIGYCVDIESVFPKEKYEH